MSKTAGPTKAQLSVNLFKFLCRIKHSDQQETEKTSQVQLLIPE